MPPCGTTTQHSLHFGIRIHWQRCAFPPLGSDFRDHQQESRDDRQRATDDTRTVLCGVIGIERLADFKLFVALGAGERLALLDGLPFSLRHREGVSRRATPD